MNNSSFSITERYKKWNNLVYKAAMKSFGKTTYKQGSNPKPSLEMTQLREERRQLKKRFEEENDYVKKKVYLEQYVIKQNEIRIKAYEEEKKEQRDCHYYLAICQKNPNKVIKELLKNSRLLKIFY